MHFIAAKIIYLETVLFSYLIFMQLFLPVKFSRPHWGWKRKLWC